MILRALLSCGLFCLPVPGRAQSCSATMPAIQFSPVDTTQAIPGDINGSLTINCTGFATPYARACISFGAPNGAWGPRKLYNGPTPTLLNYEIYSDASYTTVWDSIMHIPANLVTVDLPLSGGAGSTSVTYYARIPGGQTSVPAGNYNVVWQANDTALNYAGYSGSPPACSTNMPVSRWTFSAYATVSSSCTVSASNIDFGQVGIMGAAINATGLISTTCTYGTNYALSLNVGQGAGATFATRRMTGSSGTLGYNLYRDSTRTQAWGDGSAGSTTVSSTGNGTVQTSTVYATLPVQALPRPGAYADTITVTVTY